MKLNWNKKIIDLQEKGFTKKNAMNVKLESRKLNNFLEILRNQSQLGLFTCSNEGNRFMDAVPESKEKNQKACQDTFSK